MKYSNLVVGRKCLVCGKWDNGVCFETEQSTVCITCSSTKPTPTTSSWNTLASPTTFEQYVGQEAIKRELQIMIEATKKHHIPIQPCLFSGSYGLGKTSLAKVFAENVGSWELAIASELDSELDFTEQSNIVIVDEIHTIKSEEWLLRVIDSGSKVVLGATTTAGSLSGPLRSRFISFILQPYTVSELQIIIENISKRIGYNCPPFVSFETAKRSKGIARNAIVLFKRIYDHIVLSNNKVCQQDLHMWFNSMGIDEFGLDSADRAYLSCLSEAPIGIQNLSAVTGMDRVTIEDTIEPFLLAKGFVKRTLKGRVIGKTDLTLKVDMR